MTFDPATLLKPPTTSAFGYVVRFNDNMLIESISMTPNGAAFKAFLLLNKHVGLCTDTDCDCLVRLLVQTFPKHKIDVVRVNINVDTDPRKS